MVRALLITFTILGCALVGSVQGWLLGYILLSDPLERWFLTPVALVFGMLVGGLFGTVFAPRFTDLFSPHKDDELDIG
jgi:hypothetical protein